VCVQPSVSLIILLNLIGIRNQGRFT